MHVLLPDGSKKSFSQQPTILQVAQSLGPGLAQATVGGVFVENFKTPCKVLVQDLRTPVPDGMGLRILTSKDEEALEVSRHSAAHIMAQAVQALWPGQVQVTIGPVINKGFYYDFASDYKFTPEDLQKIENKMRELIKANVEVVRQVWPIKKAIEVFTQLNELFKVEIVEQLANEGTKEVSVYQQGDWFDLCRGPHVQRTSQIGEVKLLSVAGAYWRGDENKQQLQRIYGTAFFDKKTLKQHLHNLQEAQKRDHRKLGRELQLFDFDPVAPGMPFFLPRGVQVYQSLQNFMRKKYLKYNYHEVITPEVYDVKLYHQSGHYENFRQNMYFSKIDERDVSMKPMNCPGHCVLYKMSKKSYRDLPYRVADFGRLHRFERSGVLHGLTRVRSFCQDDAHIFCTLEQLQSEIKSFMQMLGEVYQDLGLTQYEVQFSTRPTQRMGSDALWDKAEAALQQALNELNLEYSLNPGDGAFYGPKLDIVFTDALGRPWQLGTLQCDFNMPQAFGLQYQGADNSAHQPVMLHRAILGSLERFMGVYLEHCGGWWPLWLAPCQVCVMSVGAGQVEYALQVAADLQKRGFRVEVDSRAEKLGFKIRSQIAQKVPYALVLGEKEQAQQKISVREPKGKMHNFITLDEFAKTLNTQILAKGGQN